MTLQSVKENYIDLTETSEKYHKSKSFTQVINRQVSEVSYSYR